MPQADFGLMLPAEFIMFRFRDLETLEYFGEKVAPHFA